MEIRKLSQTTLYCPREKCVSPREYKNKYERKNKENSLDHITPPKPNFREYSDEFKTCRLNNIGNLALMLWRDNAEKKSNNPLDNNQLYDGEYYSNKEIHNTLIELKAKDGDSAL